MHGENKNKKRLVKKGILIKRDFWTFSRIVADKRYVNKYSKLRLQGYIFTFLYMYSMYHAFKVKMKNKGGQKGNTMHFIWHTIYPLAG